MNAKNNIRMFLKWGDEDAKKRLIDDGHIMPIPKHSMCEPYECVRCCWNTSRWKNRPYIIVAWLKGEFKRKQDE